MMRLYLLLAVLFTCSFQAAVYSQTGDRSAIVVKLRYQSPGMSGFGGAVKVRNMQSGQVFEGKSNVGFSPFVIIENIPVGTYKVEAVSIISGSNTLVLTDESRFTLIKIDSPAVYYLGSYKTKKIPPMMTTNFRVTRTEDESKEKIYKQLDKRSETWQKFKINYEQHLFAADRTDVEIRR